MKEHKENSSLGSFAASLEHIKPCWYWDKKDLAHTPSQSEGLDPATEARYRREGARFIFDVGTRLGLYPFVFLKCEYSALPLKNTIKQAFDTLANFYYRLTNVLGCRPSSVLDMGKFPKK